MRSELLAPNDWILAPEPRNFLAGCKLLVTRCAKNPLEGFKLFGKASQHRSNMRHIQTPTAINASLHGPEGPRTKWQPLNRIKVSHRSTWGDRQLGVSLT